MVGEGEEEIMRLWDHWWYKWVKRIGARIGSIGA